MLGQNLYVRTGVIVAKEKASVAEVVKNDFAKGIVNAI
jgi:hypothetical protein